MNCGSCGYVNSLGTLTCSLCGAVLQRASGRGATTVVAEAPWAPPVLARSVRPAVTAGLPRPCPVGQAPRSSSKPILFVLLAFGALVFLAGGGILLYATLFGAKHGISEEHPLGTLEKLDKSLAKYDLTKEEVPIEIPELAGVLHAFKYSESTAQSGAKKQFVVILTDGDMNVGAVGGQWISPRQTSHQFSKAGQFLIAYWEHVGAGEPKYDPWPQGRSAASGYAKKAKFSNDKIEGEWTEEYEPDVLMISFHLKDDARIRQMVEDKNRTWKR